LIQNYRLFVNNGNERLYNSFKGKFGKKMAYNAIHCFFIRNAPCPLKWRLKNESKNDVGLSSGAM
jgi:hypothetical protein